jgi:glycosyltransferase involved in cell wall biosynthesis
MRIAMLSPVAPAHGKGGVQDIVWGLARGLAASGHDVTLITTARGASRAAAPRNPNETAILDEARLEGVSLHYLAGTTPMRALGSWLARSAAAVASLHAARPLDVIHSQSFCGVHLAGRFPGVPVVASLHGTHVDELRTSGRLMRENLSTLALREAARSAYVWMTMMRRLRGEGARLRDCDAVIATSREQHALLSREYRVSEDRLFDVWNGIDVALFAPRAADPAVRTALGGREVSDGQGAPGGRDARRPPLILAVARLYQDKGIQHLLRAFPAIEAALPGARLAIVGDGAYRRDLEALAHSLGLGERARFVGAVALDRLPALYAAADLFVNPTVRINGYDLTILQAMAMARPVVVSNIGSVPTAVTDGVDGFLAPPGDPRALADTVVRVLNDPVASLAASARARDTVESRFSLDSMVAGTLAVYERAIAARRGVGAPA